MTLEGERLTEAEVRALLAGTDGLVLLRGRWVEVDRKRLGRTMQRFREAERLAEQDGLTFAEAMRMLAGAAIALTALSGTTLIAGLNTLLGRLGLPLGVFFLLLFANPLAGFAMPAAFYPGPWGEIGQWLAPGAAATLLKAHSYFPHQEVQTAWLTLAAWAAVGVLLLVSKHGHAMIRPARSADPKDRS